MSTKPTVKPRWALTAGGADATNITTPSSGESDVGYTNGQNPVSSGKTNFLFNAIAKWINFLDDSPSFVPTTTNAPGLSSTGNGSGAGFVGTGGATGPGGAFIGGATGSHGATSTATGSGNDGHRGQGITTGAGFRGTGGASGPGVAAVAGGGGAPVTGALNLTPQVAPTTPVNGDLWVTAAAFFARIAGSTFTAALLEAVQTFTGTSTFSPSAAATPGITANGNTTGPGVAANGGATGPGVKATAGGGGSPARGAANLTPQATPSAPADGDMWCDTTVAVPRIIARLNGITAGTPTAITPGGGWGAAGNGLAYWKDAAGGVHMKGQCNWATGATTLFTFPAGFKPSFTRHFTVVNVGNATVVGVSVDASGNVALDGVGTVANGNTISFDGIAFLAEA